MSQQSKIPLSKTILNGFCVVTVKVLNSYDAFMKRRSIMGIPPAINIYTREDIYALPDGTRAELIDGQIFYMAPPTRIHQEIAGEAFWNDTELHQEKEWSL